VAVTLHGGAGPRQVEWTVELEPGGFALVQLAGAVGGGWWEVAAPPAQNLSATPAGRQALELLQRTSMTPP
jgi:hypothetical protein